MADDEPERKPEPESRDFPLWSRLIVLGILVVLLAVNILCDVFVEGYEGTATSLMLGGIIGTALGFNEFVRGRGGTP